MFYGEKETWLVVVEEKSRLLLRKQKVFQHKYNQLDKVAVVHCFYNNEIQIPLGFFFVCSVMFFTPNTLTHVMCEWSIYIYIYSPSGVKNWKSWPNRPIYFQSEKEIHILDCNLKRGLRALKTLSFICSGQWKVEKGLLVMFSVERRNFNGQFFRFLWPTKISPKIFNTWRGS